MISVYLVPLVYELCAVCFSFFIFFFAFPETPG